MARYVLFRDREGGGAIVQQYLASYHLHWYSWTGTGGYHKLEQDSLADCLTLESLVMMNEVRNFSRPVIGSLSEDSVRLAALVYLLTASTPSVTLLVMAPGPQENTPTLLT